MIIKVPRSDITDYERKYFFEADTAERRNVRRIRVEDSSVSVNDNAVDSDDVVSDNTEVDDEDTTDTTPEDTEVDAGGEDDDSDIAEEPSDDDFGDDDDMGDDDNPGEDAGGDDSDVVLEPDDDDEEPADGGGDEGDDDASDDSDGSNSDNSNDENDDERIRKKALFNKFKDLHEAIGAYIEKLNMVMAYSSELVTAYREACDKLDELNTYIYDYIVVRFVSATYTESMLTYQRALTAVSLILDGLEEVTNADIPANSKGDKKHNSNPRRNSGK